MTKHAVPPDQLTLHADRGGPMKAKATALMLTDLGVVKSHSRPHTSNDNPFSEAHFKTLKYQPEFPIARGGLVLLGEVHDNATHHGLRAELLRPSQRVADPRERPRTAAIFEHLRTDQEVSIDYFYVRKAKSRAWLSADTFLREIGWDSSGWPKAEKFERLFDAVLASGARILPGDPPRDKIRTIARQGAAAIEEADGMRLGVTAALPAPLLDGLLSELEASHCGLMPKSAFANMALAQRYRDAHLADAMMAAAERYGAAYLLAGNGHVRRDRGVPYYLQRRGTKRPILTVLLLEVEAGKSDPAAYDWHSVDGRPLAEMVIFTPRETREDPCVEMRASMQRPQPPAKP